MLKPRGIISFNLLKFARVYLVVSVCILVSYSAVAQLYHPKTGKVIPVDEPTITNWKKGVFDGYEAEFASVVVKENHFKSNSALITIPIIRIKAQSPTKKPPIFILNGGPGESNMQGQLLSDDLLKTNNVLLIGYRGVDGSVQLNCPEMKKALLSSGLTLDNAQERFHHALNSCLGRYKQNRIDIEGYSMEQVVADIEFVRSQLMLDTINILSFSFGTMLAQLYDRTYPGNVDKIAMVAPRPLNNFIFSGKDYNLQMQRLFELYYNTSDTLNHAEAKVMINDIIDKQKEFNEFRFLFFSFSKVYTLQGINKLFEAYENAGAGNDLALLNLYNEFYKNFPNNIILGDIYIKKQNKVWFSFAPDSTLGGNIAHTVNAWYNPKHYLLEREFELLTNVTFSAKVLFLCGEFDVASPPEYIIKNNYLGYRNHELKIFPEAGHLDLFYKQKKEVEEEIIIFFRTL